MNKLNVVIPMAGLGSRFLKAGYEKTKPFINVKNQMMIEHVLKCVEFKNRTVNIFCVIQKDFWSSNEIDLQYLSSKYQIKFLEVSGQTTGAASTVLSTHKSISNDIPLLVIDSDNLFHNNSLSTFVEDAAIRKLDGSLLTFFSESPSFSYAKLNNCNLVSETAEKEVISNNAICGAYFFKKGADFVNAAIMMMIYGNKQKNEFYLSNVFNFLIQDHKNIGIFNIQKSDFSCLGTPEQLNEYLRNSP